jgi:8-oxo-dGTP pyrophosphatase MutT (NUDIX family)|tara:strand:+ start:1126 stop:1578 length:453 start_codon:yes stop_codon:yes gene_type:complete
MNPKYRQAVFMVAYAKTEEGLKYLILKRKSRWRGWEFPKGGINFNETKEKTVIREILEETGKKALKIKKFKVFGKYEYKKKFPERKDFIGQEYSLYSVKIKYGNIKIDENEHSSYVWLDFGKAKKRLTFPNQKKCLKIVNDWLNDEKSKI